jgi:excisionase family DNA binding protein
MKMENMNGVVSSKKDIEPLLTAAEVSYRLHLSRSCTYSLMQSGAIPTVHIGKSRRVRVQDLENYIEKNIFYSEQQSE